MAVCEIVKADLSSKYTGRVAQIVSNQELATATEMSLVLANDNEKILLFGHFGMHFKVRKGIFIMTGKVMLFSVSGDFHSMGVD